MKVVALVAALVAAPAAAHEKGDRAMGVVESVSAERIVVKTADGHPVAFTITQETRFFRGESRRGREDVRSRGSAPSFTGKRAGEQLAGRRT